MRIKIIGLDGSFPDLTIEVEENIIKDYWDTIAKSKNVLYTDIAESFLLSVKQQLIFAGELDFSGNREEGINFTVPAWNRENINMTLGESYTPIAYIKVPRVQATTQQQQAPKSVEIYGKTQQLRSETLEKGIRDLMEDSVYNIPDIYKKITDKLIEDYKPIDLNKDRGPWVFTRYGGDTLLKNWNAYSNIEPRVAYNFQQQVNNAQKTIGESINEEMLKDLGIIKKSNMESVYLKESIWGLY